MDSGFCVRALRRAMKDTGRKPEVFNTDQGSQFTGDDWINELKHHQIQNSDQDGWMVRGVGLITSLSNAYGEASNMSKSGSTAMATLPS